MVFGASESTIGYALDYMRIYALGTIFVQLALGLNAFINAQGYAKIGMITVAIGALCNIVLDPIFIFSMSMGVKGAALATIISQAISSIFVVYFLTSKAQIQPERFTTHAHHRHVSRQLRPRHERASRYYQALQPYV